MPFAATVNMPKFFISVEDVRDGFLEIREDVHHILHVLRKEVGDTLTVCDGQGVDYKCQILSQDGEVLRCQILHATPNQAEPEVQITIFQGLPKAEKMEWLLQKGTEIGVSAFVPVATSRSIVKLEGRKADNKVARWKQIAVSAAKQSGRGRIPAVHSVQSLSSAAALLPSFDLNLVLYEEEKNCSLKQILRAVSPVPRTVSLWVGPEGGLAAEEVQALTQAGAISVGLGPRILRTETAGMVAAAMTLYEYDSM